MRISALWQQKLSPHSVKPNGAICFGQLSEAPPARGGATSNEFFPQRDYRDRIGFAFKNLRVTLVHAPDSNIPDNRGRYLDIAPDVTLAGQERPGIIISITDVGISDEAALRIIHSMLLAATGPESEER